ncbi:hypothetical protein BS50DRAFT_589629 [Corynespora cassiicola Philippines]|uniref:Uncharacterized protein n=1 Tax=Corynespora cassiicola Philippines TaxID=1448308 RepID=A0A2T2NJI2_CORCC|nr:hypothetical protein BS50DRAFT_589629 [Corynespora cassiicola Philippines]
MADVRDPGFWHRFSIAVHRDDAEKVEKELSKFSDVKHTYVKSQSTSSASSPSPVATPTSLSPLSPALHTQPLSPIALQHFAPSKSAGALASPTTPVTPQTASSTSTGPKRQPSRLKKPAPAKTRSTPSHKPFMRNKNPSLLSLGLSGRPESRFKFWTQVTADPSNRNSWLESQRKKKRQRTWICWVFWLVLLALVAGVVVAILVLKSKNII